MLGIPHSDIQLLGHPFLIVFHSTLMNYSPKQPDTELLTDAEGIFIPSAVTDNIIPVCPSQPLTLAAGCHGGAPE